MPENRLADKEPLWMLIEKQIEGLSDSDFANGNLLNTAQKISAELDQSGYNVSKSGGNWQQLKNAVKARAAVGKSFLSAYNAALDALTLDDVQNTTLTSLSLMNQLGSEWPGFNVSENRSDVLSLIEAKKLSLQTAKANELGGEQGVRYLIGENLDEAVITEQLKISAGDYKAVKDKVEAELAEIARVKELLSAVSEKTAADQIRHLLSNSVDDALIVEIAGAQQSAISDVKKAMEEELAEQKRLEEEKAAQKAAEAAGPSLDSISNDDMLEYIEGLREILEFSEVEAEIRSMAEQSDIPNCLVDIAVSDPDKLDELEEKAEG